MSEKQQQLLRELLKKAKKQQRIEEKSDEDFLTEMLLERKSDKQFGINSYDNGSDRGSDKNSGKGSDSSDKAGVIKKTVESLSKDEMFFCINRIKNDHILDAIDIKRIRLYLKPINLEELSTLLNRPIFSTSDVVEKDYRTLLINIGRFTFSRIKCFKCDSQDIISFKDHRYELGYEQFGKIHYIKFYDLFMLDYDFHDDSFIQRVEDYCKEDPNLCFYLYKTFKGYHLFCVSQPIEHQSHDNILMQDRLRGDPWYATFSYNYGYKIRISHKEEQKIDCISTFVKTLGLGKPDPYCLSLLKIHDEMIAKNLPNVILSSPDKNL